MNNISWLLNAEIFWNLNKDEIQIGNAPKYRNILMSNSGFEQGKSQHSVIYNRIGHKFASTNEGKNEGLPGLTTSALQ